MDFSTVVVVVMLIILVGVSLDTLVKWLTGHDEHRNYH